ncbi:hypothetical protein AMJ97_CH00814 [Rhizobium sp. N1314]|nr:hypothetical protein AMK02_CH00814 [Rhizobium sp. N731]ANL14699.1 hypothetical protein AMJ97_CH00814 [Rhizobium sp. N1314]
MLNPKLPDDVPSGDISFYGNDIVDTSRLPPSANAALSELRERVSDMTDLVGLASQKWNEAREAHDEATRQLAIQREKWGLSSDQFARLNSKRAEAHKMLMAVQDRRDAIGERKMAQGRLLTRIETYIRSLRSTAIQVSASAIKFPSADRLLPEIDKQRNEIATLFADRHEILSKATPSAEIKARARAEIEELARRGCPDVTYMVNHGPSQGVIWPDYEAIARGRGVGVPLPGDVGHTRFVQAPHLPLLAWLFKGRMIAAIEKEIDANAEDEQSLSLEQRTKKLAEIDARILATERVEVALVRHSGGAFDYRDDTDPRAFLGIDGPPVSEE